MASSVIHMCIAKKINQKLGLTENMLLLGSIAPDISKHLGETRTRSHFLTDGENVDIERFLDKYHSFLNDAFMLGYFIHLYTDFLWDKYFVSEIVENGTIKLLNDETIDKSEDIYIKLIYNDYTNLNVQLIDEYELNLSLFYEEVTLPDIYMDEIPISKLSLIIEQVGIIIENTKEEKAYVFNLEHIKPFIETASHLIYLKIQEILS